MKHLATFVFVILLLILASSNALDLVFDFFYQPIETVAASAILAPELEVSQETSISRSAETPELETWTITAYCACEICCHGTADNLTANLSTPLEGVTIAADPAIPFGTRIWIEGIGERTVMDRGGVIKGNRIDVYFEKHQVAKEFGTQQLKVRIVE